MVNVGYNLTLQRIMVKITCWPVSPGLNNIKNRFQVVEILYENISLTKMLSISLKVAKKYMHILLLSREALHVLGFAWHA